MKLQIVFWQEDDMYIIKEIKTGTIFGVLALAKITKEEFLKVL